MIGRRAFLTGSVAAALLAACASEDEGEGEGETLTGATGPDESAARNSLADEPPVAGRFTPVASIITRWRQDPFAFGSYSYLPPGASPADRAALGASVDGRLFFAGEATSLSYPATVHGALLSGRSTAADIDAVSNDGDAIVIIGAGAAGLGAARSLAEAGYAVTIVEGRDRIGGRVHSDMSLGASLEIGAGWIHGADGNPLTELAEQFNVERFVTDEDESVLYDTDGEEVDDDLLESMEDLLQQLDFDGAATVGDVIETAIAKLDDNEARIARYVAGSVVEHEVAADIGQLSPESLVEGEEFGGDETVMPNGYINLLAPLAEGIDVQLERIVTSIGHSDKGVEIQFDDDSVVFADRVLVTVPLGVLKAGVITFEPELPGDKLAAIGRLGMGVLDRVILEFDEVFWDEDVELIGYVGDEPGLFIEWDNWARVVGKPIIVGFNAGSVAERIEALPDNEVIALAVRALTNIYG
jgi:polyamine oxidase